MTPRPFQLMFDSGAPWLDPKTRYFGSLDAALAALAEMPAKWQSYAWVIENPGQRRDSVVHVKYGEREAA